MNTCFHEDHQNNDTQTLYTEALGVGLTLVPVWFAVRAATTAVRWRGPWKEVADVVLAGFLYHLTAEHVGLNDWYVANGHVAQKSFRALKQQGDVVADVSDMDWIRGLGRVDWC
jgi:hypothetical protein